LSPSLKAGVNINLHSKGLRLTLGFSIGIELIFENGLQHTFFNPTYKLGLPGNHIFK
jgi:hypothetical protein